MEEKEKEKERKGKKKKEKKEKKRVPQKNARKGWNADTYYKCG